VKTAVIKGHRVAANMIELDEPLPAEVADVDVVLRMNDMSEQAAPQSLADFLRSLPPGTRSKADIEQQMQEERRSWPD
jgi:hypothetical protein